MPALASARSSCFLRGATAVAQAPRAGARRAASLRASAKYGDEGRFFDLSDLENTIGSWDMYGQQDASRYNGLQAEFFERAAGGLTRREYLNALCALGGGAAILVWGAKGSADAGLPITKGPQKGGEAGPRGRK